MHKQGFIHLNVWFYILRFGTHVDVPATSDCVPVWWSGDIAHQHCSAVNLYGLRRDDVSMRAVPFLESFVVSH